MTTTTERFAIVAFGFERRIVGCPPDQWGATSPCPPWTAGEIVDHVLENFRQTLAAAGRNLDLPDDQPVLSRWQASRRAMLAAMEDPEAASKVVPSPVGELAFKQMAGGVILHDLLVHTWDLARATGQDETLDSEAVASAFAKMTPFDELLRGPAMFGEKVSTPDGSDVQTQFLAFVGRLV